MTQIEDLFGARTAVIVEQAITAGMAADVRARLERAGYARYQLLDRGSYDVTAHIDEPALIAHVVARAEQATGRTLGVVEQRVLRLGPGDYLLAHHDQIHEGHPLELIVDLSAAAVPGAEVHYRRRGQAYFRVPSAPRSLAIVERGPTVSCNHTYVSKRDPDAAVLRLMLLLRDR